MASNIKVALELDNQQYTNALNKSRQNTKEFATQAKASASEVSNSMKKMGDVTNGVSSQFSKLKGILAGAAFIGFAKSALTMGAAMSDLSDATGFTIDQIARLRQALQSNGVAADKSRDALTDFIKKLDEAAKGSSTIQDQFAKVGVTLKDLATLSERDLFAKTVAGISNLRTPAERAGAAMILIGESMKGINLAADGSFVRILEEGNIESEKLAASAKRAAELTALWAKTYDDLRLAFLEAFEPIIRYMAQLLKDMPNLIKYFKILGAVIVATFVLSGLKTFVTLISSAVSGVTLLVNALRGLKGAMSLGAAGKLAAGAVPVIGAVAAGGVALDALNGPDKSNPAASGKIQFQTDGAKQTAAAVRRVIDANIAQRKSITDVTDAYRLGNATTLQKIQQDAKMIGLNADQKESMTALAEVHTRANETILKLQAKKADGQDKNNKLIELEIAQVRALESSQVTAIETAIKAKQREQKIDNDLVAAMERRLELQQTVADIQNGYMLDGLTGQERKLKEIELAEKKVAEAALLRIQIESRKLPVNDRTAYLATEGAKIKQLFEESVAQQQAAVRAGEQQSRSFESGWNKAFKEYADNATNAAKTAQSVFQKATSGMEDMIVNFAKTGKFEFKSFVSDILETLLRSQIQQTMAQMFNIGGLTGGGGGGGGNIISSLGKLLGFANGGVIPTNGPVIVGERGPELLTGAAGRQVIPNNQLGGGSVTYNISAVDAQSFQALVARDPGFIHAVAMAGANQTAGRR